MRALLSDTNPGVARRRALMLAALLLGALCAIAMAWEGTAPALTPQEKLEKTQGKLDEVREDSSALADTIAEQNRAIDSMIGTMISPEGVGGKTSVTRADRSSASRRVSATC